MKLTDITKTLRQKETLSEEALSFAAESLTSADFRAQDKRAFLEALHDKGESVEDVTAFASVFRRLARDPQMASMASSAIDIVGTGGSGSRGYNFSSVSSLIVAAAGYPVMKHGNRAITSSSGAADFLGEVGIPPAVSLEVLKASLESLNFCFFFAPAFHPAFKEIMPVRKAMAADGKRSIFNILGPLINPGKPAHQLLGVFHEDWVHPLADVLHHLGLTRGLAVCSVLDSDGGRMDELTTAGVNYIKGVGDFSDMSLELRAEDVGLKSCHPDALRGGTAQENYERFEAILKGDVDTPLVDSICLNAGAALWILKDVDSLEAGISRVRSLISGGEVEAYLRRLQAFYKENLV